LQPARRPLKLHHRRASVHHAAMSKFERRAGVPLNASVTLHSQIEQNKKE
jgi:hypothetical protein